MNENNTNIEYIVSSCLAGIPCRYNCTHKDNKYVNDLIRNGKAIPLCPEQIAGLPTPREACECKIVNGKLKVYSKSGNDYTDYFYNGAEMVLKFAKKYNIKKAILQKNSPSCGKLTYDGTFTGKLSTYSGITAKLLMENNIEVISSDEIND